MSLLDGLKQLTPDQLDELQNLEKDVANFLQNPNDNLTAITSLNRMNSLDPERAKNYCGIMVSLYDEKDVINLLPSFDKDLSRFAQDLYVEKNLLTSKGNVNLLRGMTSAITNLYDKDFNPTVSLDYDYNGLIKHETGYTNGSHIHINAGNQIVQMGRDLDEKQKILNGIAVHEVSHILYTDISSSIRMLEDLAKGKLPEETADLAPIKNEKYEENKSLLESDIKSSIFPAEAFIDIIHRIDNIIEDGYIERRFHVDFTGQASDCLTVLQNAFYRGQESLESLDELALKHPESVSHSALNLLLTYAKYGAQIKKDNSRYDEILSPVYDYVKEALPFAKEAIYADFSPYRREFILGSFISIYDKIRDSLLEEAARNLIENVTLGNNPPGGGGQQPPGFGDDDRLLHTDQSVEELKEIIKQMLEEEAKGQNQGQGGGASGRQWTQESQQKIAEAMRQAMEEMKDTLDKNTDNQQVSKDNNSGNDSPLDQQNDSRQNGNNGNNSQKGQGKGKGSDSGSGQSGEDKKVSVDAPTQQQINAENQILEEERKAEENLNKIGSTIGENIDKLKDDLEKKEEALAKQAKDLRDKINKGVDENGNPLSGEDIKDLRNQLNAVEDARDSVRRAEPYYYGDNFSTHKLDMPLERAREGYERLYKKEIELGRLMADLVRDELVDLRGTDMLYQQTKGQFHVDSFVRNVSKLNDAYYQRQTAPLEEEFCKISLIIDNSGSMYPNSINYAKRATALMASFCEELAIPYSIDFFSDPGSNVEICDFDKPRGELEKTRIAATDALSRFSSGTDLLPPLLKLKERLDSSPDALGNIMIVISDGETYNGELCVSTMKKMQEENNLEPIIMTFEGGYRKGEVKRTWEDTISREAELDAAINGISPDQAKLDAADFAADVIAEVPNLQEAPTILGNILVDKIRGLFERTGRIV